jgi:hypothetical protein
MKILVIGGTGHVDASAFGPARCPKVKVAIGDLIRSDIYPELIDLNVHFLMRVTPRPCWFCALALFLFPGNVHSSALLLLFQFKSSRPEETGNAIR